MFVWIIVAILINVIMYFHLSRLMHCCAITSTPSVCPLYQQLLLTMTQYCGQGTSAREMAVILTLHHQMNTPFTGKPCILHYIIYFIK